MRYIAFDLGDKRTGVAVGDSITRLVSPVDVLEVPARQGDGEALLAAIAAAVEEHLGTANPGRAAARGEVVVGLPVNMDGTEGPRAKVVREVAARIAARTGREVRFQDERLTSAAADWDMARSGLTHKQKKARRDALAAAAILRDFLAAALPGARPDRDE
jgi:putative Holliday junction resolvase